MESKPQIIVIVGETASGKSDLAIELAEKFGGEVVCADSRTIYKGLDIGTAKPTIEDRQKVRHHLLDLVRPDERFTVADFKQLAQAAIEDIDSRGKLPIVAGGTGLYIDALVYNYQFSSGKETKERDAANPRHLLRRYPKKTAKNLRPNTLILGLALPREELRERITKRAERAFDIGLVEETKRLTEQGYAQCPALDSTSYKAVKKLLAGSLNSAAAKQEFINNDLSLAKKQRTWFKRNKSIQWVTDRSKAVDLATTFLNK